MVGRVLGNRYRLDSLLGQGGMSSVYKATDPNLRRTVAIKLIHPHLTTDPEFVRRFESEAAAVAQLRHPNIIQVYDFERDGDTYYMVLEYVSGESLDRRLRRLAAEKRRMGPDEAAGIIADIAEAVDYAHGTGLIHRDIKPANIMLTERGQSVLMDFGIAKIIGGTEHTATGMLVGTAFYISPEQVRGEPPSAQSDIYALGVTLFEVLAGRPPFTGDSAMSVMLKHVSEPVPDLRRIAPETPLYLIAVVERAMAKDPRERYPSARDMAAALRQTGSLSAGGPPTMMDRAPGRSALVATGFEPDVAAAAAQRSSPLSLGAPRAAPPFARPSPASGLAQRPASPLAAPPLAAPPGPAMPRAAAAPRQSGSRACVWLAVLTVFVLLGVFLFFGAGTAFLMIGYLKPTATPPPTITPTAAPSVVYQDDFSDPTTGWTTYSRNYGTIKYDNSSLLITNQFSNTIVWSTPASGDVSNIHIEVTVSNTGSVADEGFGVICNYTDDNNYYYMGISLNGYYEIARRQNGQVTVLTDAANNSWVLSRQIAQNVASYRVGADCGSDGTLTLYADGQQVATANDTTYKNGLIGLFLVGFNDVPAEARFTDLVVTSLP